MKNRNKKFCSLLCLLVVMSFLLISQESNAASKDVLHLALLTQDLKKEWKHHKYVKETQYSWVTEEGKPAIYAVGQQSASGLYKKVNYSLKKYPWLEWGWKLKTLHKTANLKIKEKEDMALGVFLIFPHPWFPWKSKVLAYVWVSAQHQAGSVIQGRGHPYIILEAGAKKKGRWITEKRNAYEDYKQAYGEYPKGNVEAIALFTDNDQTREPVAVYYGAIKALKD